jgi:hypothetical protein
MHQHAALDLLAGHVVSQHEVAVRDLRPFDQADARAGGRGVLEVDLVQLRLDAEDRHPGFDVDRDGDVVAGARSLGRDGRRDA